MCDQEEGGERPSFPGWDPRDRARRTWVSSVAWGMGRHASAIIALCALVVSVYVGFETRRHNRLSVQPYMVFTHGAEGVRGPSFYRLHNFGLGPAIVDRCRVWIDSTLVYDSTSMPVCDAVALKRFIREVAAALPDSSGVVDTFYGPIRGQAIRSGQAITVFSWWSTDRKVLYVTDCALVSSLVRFRIRVEYHSAYGETDVIDTDMAPPQTSSSWPWAWL